MSSVYSYKFSPSILDAFQGYLDCEANYERFFGHSEEPSMAYADYERQKLQELIDRINRKPFESEAASKGSCLNEIVDSIVLGVRGTRDDITVRSIRSGGDLYCAKKGDDISVPDEHLLTECQNLFRSINLPSFIYARNGAYEFLFDTSFCKRLAEYFRDSLCQIYTEAAIETERGMVLLYGYPDYVRGDMVYDLKTTGRYEFGKYAKYWQQHVYPYTLTESGKCRDISAFEFTACQMKGGTARSPLVYGDMYPEVYVYDHERSTKALRGICTQFAEFLEAHRDKITDKKIFGGEKDFDKKAEVLRKEFEMEII